MKKEKPLMAFLWSKMEGLEKRVAWASEMGTAMKWWWRAVAPLKQVSISASSIFSPKPLLRCVQNITSNFAY